MAEKYSINCSFEGSVWACSVDDSCLVKYVFLEFAWFTEVVIPFIVSLFFD